MPKRNRPGLSEATRKRIQTTMIVKQLEKHVLGKVEMTATQVTAALGLIRKTLPDLQSQEIKAEVKTRQNVINAEPMTTDEWESKYTSDMEPTARAPKSIN